MDFIIFLFLGKGVDGADFLAGFAAGGINTLTVIFSEQKDVNVTGIGAILLRICIRIDGGFTTGLYGDLQL